MIDIVREIEAVQREVGEGTIPAGTGHLGSWQTGAGAGVKHNWSPR